MNAYRRHVIFLLAACAASLTDTSQAANVHWTNPSGGTWSQSSNWSPNRVPTGTDHAIITNAGLYTVTLDDGVTLSKLTFGAGEGGQTLEIGNELLAVTNRFVINPAGVVNLDGGAIDSGGETIVSGVINWSEGTLYEDFEITTSGRLNITGRRVKDLDKAEIVNHGVIAWDDGELNVVKTSSIENYGTFDVTSTDLISDKSKGTVFVNHGELRFMGGNTFNTFDEIELLNYGILNLGNATLTLQGASQGGTHSLESGTMVTGTGQFILDGAPVWADGIIELAAQLELRSGWLSSKDVWWVGTELKWTGGGFDGHFIFPTNMTVEISGNRTKFLYQAELENHGTFNLNSAGAIEGDKRQGILNFGELNLIDSGSLAVTSGNAPALWNAGVINFAGQLKLLQSQFDYEQDDAGILNLGLGGSSSGQYDRLILEGEVDLGGTLNLVLENGYVPELQDELRIITCVSNTTQFANLTGAGNYFRLRSTPDNVSLVADVPGILSQPQSQSVLEFSRVSINVQTEGPTLLQWYHDDLPLPGQTANSLVLPSVTTPDAGTYKVVAQNFWGAITSEVATLVVMVPAEIVAGPSPKVALQDEDVILEVVARGTDLFYRWKKNGAIIPGRTGPQLFLPSVGPEDDAKYRVEVGNALNTLASPEVELTVILRPVITDQPDSKQVNPGSDLALEVKAEGTQPFSYLWFKDGVPIANSNNKRLELRKVTKANNGIYKVIVANSAGNVESMPVSLLVNEAPVITQQPQSQPANSGSTVLLGVTATGVPAPTYQWRLNGVSISGATTSSLLITNVQPEDGGSYRVVVKNSIGTVESVAARLEVIVPWLPFADMFAERGIIYTASGTGRGTNTVATREEGEKDHKGSKSPESSIWISWWAPANGIATFSTAGSDFDTVMAVYEGGTLSTVDKLKDDDDGAPFHCSEIAFNARAGTYYQIVVAGHDLQDRGMAMLSWDLEITTEQLPRIIQAPLNRTAQLNETLNVSVSFQAFETTLTQWFYQGQPLPAATNSSLVISNIQATQVGGYAVKLTGASGRTVVSPPGDIQINTEGATNVAARAKFLDALNHALTQ